MRTAECKEGMRIGISHTGQCRETRAVSVVKNIPPPSPCSFSPCEEGGNCEEHDGTFSCHCVQGRAGKYCQEEVEETVYTEAGFMGESYAVLDTESGPSMITRTAIEISFRTFTEEGVILLAGQRDTRRKEDYLSICLVGGHVEVRYDLGSGHSVLTSSHPVTLGTWHTMVFRRYRQDGVLQVDSGNTVRGRAPGRNKSLNIKGDMFLGGHPHINKTGEMVTTSQGLVGCVRRVRIQGHSVRIGGQGVVSCDSHPCKEGYCKNQGQCRVRERGREAVCSCRQGFRGRRCHKKKKYKAKDRRKKKKNMRKKNRILKMEREYKTPGKQNYLP